MKNIDDFKSRKDWQKYLWQSLMESIKKSPDSEILNSILTEYEKERLAKRFHIQNFLNQGKSYSEISKILWISPNTISSINKSLKRKKYESYWEESKNRESSFIRTSLIPNKKKSKSNINLFSKRLYKKKNRRK